MYALDAQDGSVIWRFNKTYANDTTHNDVPGVAAIIDDAGDGGPVNKVYFGDLEGKVWSIDATDRHAGDGDLRRRRRSTCRPTRSTIRSRAAWCSTAIRPTRTSTSLGVTGSADWVPSTTLLAGVQGRPVDEHGDDADHARHRRARLRGADGVGQQRVLHHRRSAACSRRSAPASRATGNLMRIDLGNTPSVTTLATVKQGASEVAVDANGNVIAASAVGHHAERQQRRRQLAGDAGAAERRRQADHRPRLARPALADGTRAPSARSTTRSPRSPPPPAPPARSRAAESAAPSATARPSAPSS